MPDHYLLRMTASLSGTWLETSTPATELTVSAKDLADKLHVSPGQSVWGQTAAVDAHGATAALQPVEFPVLPASTSPLIVGYDDHYAQHNDRYSYTLAYFFPPLHEPETVTGYSGRLQREGTTDWRAAEIYEGGPGQPRQAMWYLADASWPVKDGQAVTLELFAERPSGKSPAATITVRKPGVLDYPRVSSGDENGFTLVWPAVPDAVAYEINTLQGRWPFRRMPPTTGTSIRLAWQDIWHPGAPDYQHLVKGNGQLQLRALFADGSSKITGSMEVRWPPPPARLHAAPPVPSPPHF